MARNLHYRRGELCDFSSHTGTLILAINFDPARRPYMSKSVYLALFVLAVALAYASSETSGNKRSSQSQTTSSQTPSSQGASSGTSSSQTPAQPSPSSQNNPALNTPGGATDASGGGVAGAAGSAAAKTQVPESPETPSAVAAVPDADLQSQIQNALSKEPTLSGDMVNVNVTAEAIDVTGSVATAREKQTTTRIIQSYAGNKKVVNHLTVSGRNRNAAPGATTPK
jgi:BON domain